MAATREGGGRRPSCAEVHCDLTCSGFLGSHMALRGEDWGSEVRSPPPKAVWSLLLNLLLPFFCFFFFFFFLTVPMACGGSQARDQTHTPAVTTSDP